MHPANIRWWNYCSSKYWPYFWPSDGVPGVGYSRNSQPWQGVKVAEFGSRNVNGTLRDYFRAPLKYIGVDWREGKCVDVVSLAHEVNLNETFNTVVSASMLEHDPYWQKSLHNMVKHLATDGILILSWGSALNKEHCNATAPDGKFHPLAVGKVIHFLFECGLHIHEFRYDSDFGGRPGCACLAVFKDIRQAINYTPHFGKLLDEDC